MKLKQIALAAALVVSGTAHATLPTTGTNGPAAKAIIDDAVANNRVIFISGASAVQKGFTGIVETLFTGTKYRFANTTASSKDYEAVAGKLTTAAGSWPANSNVIIVYRTKGGSVWGVDPVARAQVIESLNVTDAACSGAETDGTAATPFTCTLTTRTPDAGVSDVAPALFKQPYNTEGETAAAQLTAAELARFSGNGAQKPIYGLAFGLAMTNNFFPELSKTEVAGILAGNFGDWSEVSSESGDIVVCRRVPGSGTQATYNLYFNGFPCGPSGTPADRDSSGAWDNASNTYTVVAGEGLQVVENSTSGDVRNCLQKAISGGTYSTSDRSGAAVTVDFGAGGFKAIGTLSLDSMGSSKTSTSTWSFRAFNGTGQVHCDTTCSTAVAPVATGSGLLPTFANFENADWDFQGLVSFNIPARTHSSTGTLEANKRVVLDKFVTNAQNPAILQTIADLKYVAAGIPTTTLSGPFVMDGAYAGGTQCGNFSKVYND